MTPTTVYAHLEAGRLARGLSLRALAEELGCGIASLVRWRHGHSDPSARTLCAALAWLAAQQVPPPPPPEPPPEEQLTAACDLLERAERQLLDDLVQRQHRRPALRATREALRALSPWMAP